MSEKIFREFVPKKEDALTDEEEALLKQIQAAVGTPESQKEITTDYSKHPDAEKNLHPIKPPAVDEVLPGPETVYPKKPAEEM